MSKEQDPYYEKYLSAKKKYFELKRQVRPDLRLLSNGSLHVQVKLDEDKPPSISNKMFKMLSNVTNMFGGAYDSEGTEMPDSLTEVDEMSGGNLGLPNKLSDTTEEFTAFMQGGGRTEMPDTISHINISTTDVIFGNQDKKLKDLEKFLTSEKSTEVQSLSSFDSSATQSEISV